jgi:dimethylamine corrinoid protein
MNTNTQNPDTILNELAESVVAMDENKTIALSLKALSSGIDAYTAISKGLAKGMEIMGENYEKGICFIPELLIASDAMYAGMDILKPHLKTDESMFEGGQPIGVIGVIEGDTHDIGKNLVKTMFEVSGFKMIDLGRDVPPKRFIETAVKEDAGLICLSSLMTTAMIKMADVITGLTQASLKPKIKVMVGGACISPAFSRRIGADGYAPNALAAVAEAKRLLNEKNGG